MPIDQSRLYARIPADIEREDRVMLGLTARQLAVLAVTGTLVGLVLWAAQQLEPTLPPPVMAVLSLPFVAVGAALAFGQRDGVSLDRLALAAVRQAAAPRALPSPALATSTAPTGSRLRERANWLLPPPSGLPVRGVHDDGVVDLGAEGQALVCAATPVSFALRSPQEQAAQLGVMVRFLHTLTSPTQILIRTRPVDLRPVIDDLARHAAALPHPSLQAAASDHAEFLTRLDANHDVFAREVLVVFRQPARLGSRREARTALHRRAQDAATVLVGAAITLTPLARSDAIQVLGLDVPEQEPQPPSPPPDDEPITGRRAS